MTKIFITGHKGFIGSYLFKFLEKDYQIVTIDKKISKNDPGNLNNFEKSNIVIHAAANTGIQKSWENSDEFYQDNIFSTKAIIDYCLKHDATLIYISSYLYGNTKILPTPETVKLIAMNPYASSKKECEELCLYYQKKSLLKLVIVRPFNIYGYFKKSHQLIMSILNQAIKEKKVVVSDLQPKRDMLYIIDFCKFIRNLIEKNIVNDIFNVGSGENYSVKEIIEIIQKLSNSHFQVHCTNELRKNEIFETRADISKAKKTLNWQPSWSIEKGILATIESF